MSPYLAAPISTALSFPRVSGDEPTSPSVTRSGPSFPRVSGDEPFDGNFFGVEEEFSPRERG